MRTPYDLPLTPVSGFANGHPNADIEAGPEDVGWTEATDRGYALVVQVMRGRYGSDGVFSLFLDEVEDGGALIRWIEKQPWSNGRIGIFGDSASGVASLQAAASGRPSIRAVYAQATSPDFIGGVIFPEGRVKWEALLPFVLSQSPWPPAGTSELARTLMAPANALIIDPASPAPTLGGNHLTVSSGMEDQRPLLGRADVAALTLAWFEHWLRCHALQVPGWRACSALQVAVLWLELGWIALQSARGEDSHFNAGSVFEGLMFSLKGLGAAWMTAVTAYLGSVAGWHWVCAHPGRAREPLLLGIALGCLLSGVLLAWTGEALVEAGVSQSAIGAAHLPLLGWRLDGSDPGQRTFSLPT